MGWGAVWRHSCEPPHHVTPLLSMLTWPGCRVGGGTVYVDYRQQFSGVAGGAATAAAKALSRAQQQQHPTAFLAQGGGGAGGTKPGSSRGRKSGGGGGATAEGGGFWAQEGSKNVSRWGPAVSGGGGCGSAVSVARADQCAQVADVRQM